MIVALVTLFIASTGTLSAEDSRATIRSLYTDALRAMRTAQTKEDITRMVEAIDIPEWTSSLVNGQTMTRQQAVRELESLLAVPPENRPLFHIEPIYWNETAAAMTVVYWVYIDIKGNRNGSIARDTWARTAAGWRRTRHEKVFPDRPLMKDGKPVFLPE